MLMQRIATAVVLLPIVIGVILYGGFLLKLLTFLLFIGINLEFYSFVPGFSLNQRLQLLLCNSVVPIGFVMGEWKGVGLGVIVGIILTFVMIVMLIDSEDHQPNLSNIVPTCFLGFSYVGILGSVLFILSSKANNHQYFLLWLLTVVVLTDTSAYFGGRSIGGVKLAPRISPTKTISGSVCGVVGGVIGGVGFSYFWGIGCGMWEVAFYSLCGSVLCQIGDLAESMIKRTYNVKDSGVILPGHGGLLDRIDGLLFAAPLLLIFGS